MATTDDKNVSKVTADRPNGGVANVSASDPASPSAVTHDVPETPAESTRASMRVVPAWPCKSFVIEGIPEITVAGTMLTKTQLATAEASAEASGVSLVSEEVK